MPVGRTSKSLLFDRFVRVDRRGTNYDGVGGTFQTWTEIISRYWVRIFPDHHQERRKQELGEIALETTHGAVGNRSWNGATIMIGDRFIDEKNNETYDVVGVIRPMARLPYSHVYRYVLRIVKDERAYGS